MRNTTIMLLGVIILAITGLACGLEVRYGDSNTPTAIAEPPIATPVPPTATPTNVPPTATPSPAPTLRPTSTGRRVYGSPTLSPAEVREWRSSESTKAAVRRGVPPLQQAQTPQPLSPQQLERISGQSEEALLECGFSLITGLLAGDWLSLLSCLGLLLE